MKTTTSFNKKLVLHKETLRTLTDQEMSLVAGGTNGCGTNTCNTCLAGPPCQTNTSRGETCTSGQYSVCGQRSCLRCITATTG